MTARDGLSGRQPHAVLSGLSVLEEVARIGPGVTAQQISASTGLPRATTYRLLNLLVEDEYLVRLPDLRGFALGTRVSQLTGVAARRDAESETRQILADLRGRIRGGVHLGVYSSGGLALQDVDPDFPIADEKRVTSDLSASALGRLLISERARGGSGTPGAFAIQENEFTQGYGCLAVPIRDGRGTLIAGVALAMPVRRLEDRAAVVELIEPDRLRLERVLSG